MRCSAPSLFQFLRNKVSTKLWCTISLVCEKSYENKLLSKNISADKTVWNDSFYNLNC